MKRYNRFALAAGVGFLIDAILAYRKYYDFMQEYELGLFWDMLVDLAKELRKDDSDLNPIKGFGKSWLFLAGWSLPPSEEALLSL